MNDHLAAIVSLLLTLSLAGQAKAQSAIIIDDCGVSYIDPQDIVDKETPGYDTVVYQAQFEQTNQQRAYYVDVNAFGGRQVDRATVSAIMPDGAHIKMGEIAFGNCVDCVAGFALVYNDSVWVEQVSDRMTMDLWLQSFNQPPFSLTSNLQTLTGVGRLSGLLPLCAAGIDVTFIIFSDPSSTTTEFAAQVVCPRIVRDCEIDLFAEVDCQKDSVFLRADLPVECFSDGARLSWRNANGFYTERAAASLPLTGNEGMFYFTVEDEYCLLVDSVLVENPAFAEAGPDQPACQGDEVILEGAGGLQYFWERGQNERFEGARLTLPAVQAADAGQYILHAFNEAGCEDTDTLWLTVRVPPPPQVTVSDACLGDTVVFFVENDSAFVRISWFDPLNVPLPAPVITGLQEADFGDYTVETIDRFGCRLTSGFSVTARQLPAFEYLIESGCDSARVYLSQEHYRYEWDHGLEGPVLTTSSGGVFSLTVIDSFGCRTREVIEVPPPDGPELSLTVEHPLCPNEFGAVELTLADPDLPAIFSIDGGRTYTLSNRFEGLTPGNYTLTVQDELGCIQNFPIEVIPPDTLGVEIGLESLEVRPGTVVVLEAETVGQVTYYQWLPREIDTGTAQTEFTAETNLDIRLIVEDQRGCRMSDGFPLTIVLGDIYAPNAFSPDDDGNNDTFMLYSDNGSGEIIEWLRVFDRYGELLFEASDIFPNDESNGWDGNHRGRPMNTGVYVYQAVVRFGNGVRKEYKGDVVLMR